MKFSIVIATYKRADILGDTLKSLAALKSEAPWEVIVVDNNSPDRTRAVVESLIPTFPVPLIYAFEREQGRSAALNRGFELARGEIIVTTDDDVRVEFGWLDRQDLHALHRPHALHPLIGRAAKHHVQLAIL